MGTDALYTNTTGYQNSAFGYQASLNSTTGHSNVAIGWHASLNSTGTAAYRNTAIGGLAIPNTTGRNTVGIGYKSGYNNSTGDHNTFLGAYTNVSPTDASWNNSTAIGYNSKITASDQIVLGVSTTNVYVPYRMGIGTTSPGAGLHIENIIGYGPNDGLGYVKYISQSHSYASTSNSNSGWNVSMHASGGIGCASIVFHSDSRIKKNIMDVPDNLALQQVRDISSRYYEYIDDIKTGPQKTIGFIAQEVKEVLPMAVKTMTKIIPDEYRILEGVSWEEIGDISSNITYKMSSDLTDVSGVKYKFVVLNDLSDNEIEKNVIGNADNTFTFDSSYQNVFCYGKEVDDFHIVDKNKIFALHHSAIQEIDRLQLEEKEKTTALETKVTELETKNTPQLNHSFVEGPRMDNIYRGHIQLANGAVEINLDTQFNMTEGTFIGANQDISVFTTNEDSWDNVRGKVTGNILKIECQNTESTALISYLVIGERHTTPVV